MLCYSLDSESSLCKLRESVLLTIHFVGGFFRFFCIVYCVYFVSYFSWLLFFLFLVWVFGDQEDRHFVHHLVNHFVRHFPLVIGCVILFCMPVHGQ